MDKRKQEERERGNKEDKLRQKQSGRKRIGGNEENK